MKRSFLLLIVLALTAGLFIACDNNIEAKEEFVYVEFSIEQGKDIENTISESSDLGNEYPVDKVYWFYTAEKTAGRGTIGSTLSGDKHKPVLINEAGGLEGKIGPFSPGTWEFKLSGYAALTEEKEGKDLVYNGVCTLGKTTGSVYLERQDADTEYQTITVALKNELTTGTVYIKDSIFNDQDNGTLQLTTEVVREDENKKILEGTVSIEPVKGETYYSFNLFEGLLKYDDVAREIDEKTEEETDTIIWSKVPEGVYKIKSYLWFDENEDGKFTDDELVHEIYNDYMILYPREVLTISGNVIDKSSLAYVDFGFPPVASVVHNYKDGDESKTHEYWFGSLQDAVDYASEGDTVNLFRAPDTSSIVVNRLIDIKGPYNYIKMIRKVSSISDGIIAYTREADTSTDEDDLVLHFVAGKEVLVEMLKEEKILFFVKGIKYPVEYFEEKSGGVVLRTYKVTFELFEGDFYYSYYDYNHYDIDEYTYAIGSALEEDPNNIRKENYTFAGWYTNSEYIGEPVTSISATETGDKTFYAKWTPNTYGVTLYTNGGAINSGNVTEYTYGTGATLPEDVTKEGYAFAGWYADDEFNGDVVTAITETASGYKDFYAKWTPNTYTVVFDKNSEAATGEMVSQSFTYDDGKALTANAFTRDGYTFAGWNTVAEPTEDEPGTAYSDKEEVQNLTSTANDTVTLYAQWATNRTVTLNANGGTCSTVSVTVADGMAYGELPEPTKAGYTFKGWYTAETEGTEVESTTVNNRGEDHTLYAHWTANTYTVTLNTNDGTINSGNVEKYTYATAVTLPTDVTRTGYTFGGWYAGESCEGDSVSEISATEMENKTFYAKWTANSYTVEFNANGGTTGTMADQTFTYDEAAKVLTTNAFTRTYYTFAGWNTVAEPTEDKPGTAYSDGAEVQNLTSTANDTVILYAQWEHIKIHITFKNWGGSTCNDMDVNAGVAFVMPGADYAGNDSDYVFKGYWTSEEDGQGTQYTSGESYSFETDTTLYGAYDPAVTVSFDAGGGSVTPTSKSFTPGQTYGDLPTPTKEEYGYLYTFAGWYTSSDGGDEVTADATCTDSVHTLYAHWTVKVLGKYSSDNSFEGSSGNLGYYTPGEVVDLTGLLPTPPQTIGEQFDGYIYGGTHCIVYKGTSYDSWQVTTDDLGEFEVPNSRFEIRFTYGIWGV